MTKEEKKKSLEDLQQRIDEEKAKVKSGEITTGMYYAFVSGLLSAHLFIFYNDMPNIELNK